MQFPVLLRGLSLRGGGEVLLKTITQLYYTVQVETDGHPQFFSLLALLSGCIVIEATAHNGLQRPRLAALPALNHCQRHAYQASSLGAYEESIDGLHDVA
jgi:hypothetical protein